MIDICNGRGKIRTMRMAVCKYKTDRVLLFLHIYFNKYFNNFNQIRAAAM